MDIIGLYRSPSAQFSNTKLFIEKDVGEILQMVKQSRDCIWLSDSNIDLLRLKDEFSNKIATDGLQAVSSEPTRRETTSATAIGHVFMRQINFELLGISVVNSGGLTHHSMMKCTIVRACEPTLSVGGRRTKTNREKFTTELCR